jgi:hypothetical protein
MAVAPFGIEPRNAPLRAHARVCPLRGLSLGAMILGRYVVVWLLIGQ